MEAIREAAETSSLDEVIQQSRRATIDHMVGIHEAYFGSDAAENMRELLEESSRRPVRDEFRLPPTSGRTPDSSEGWRHKLEERKLIRRDDPVAMEKASQEIIHPAATEVILDISRYAQKAFQHGTELGKKNLIGMSEAILGLARDATQKIKRVVRNFGK